MGVAIYPRIQGIREDGDICGRALAAELERLHEKIKGQGFKELMEYFVPSLDDAEEFELTVEDAWYPPEEGLSLMDAMIAAVYADPAAFERTTDLKADLLAFRSILERANAEGKLWNLAMDY